MALLRFKTGAEVSIDGVPHRFVDFVGLDGPGVASGWFLRRLDSRGGTELVPLLKLRDLYDRGRLRAFHSAAVGGAAQAEVARKHLRHSVDDLSVGERTRRLVRADFIVRVQQRIGFRGANAQIGTSHDGKPDTLLRRTLEEVSREMQRELQNVGLHDRRPRSQDGRPVVEWKVDGKPGDDEDLKLIRVDLATYYRWLKRYDPEDKRGLEGDHAARGNRNQILPVVRETIVAVMLKEIEKAKDKRGIGKPGTVTMTVMAERISQALGPLRLVSPELADRIKLPSRPTLYNIWKQFPSFDRTIAMEGMVAALRKHRLTKGNEGPDAPFDLVEYDETRMPFWFVDEKHGIPLGRANLCSGVCVATRVVGGFYLGFEPFSDMTMMATLQNLVSLKSYVQEHYPQIHNPWVAGGMPRCVGIDNSRQAWGRTLKEVAKTIDCDRTWLPPRTPWFKPIIEGFFHQLNTLLLQHLPGFALGRAVDRKDYNPAVNACIGLRQFTFLFHAWLCDIYHVRPQEGIEHRSPNQKWEELLVNGEPGLLDSADDVASLFGIVREGTLDHRGLRLMGIPYGGDALAELIRQCGSGQKLKFKFSPADLLHARVYHPRLRDWVRAEAIRRDYADGLSLHVHKLVQAHVRRRGQEENVDSYIVGLAHLKQLVADTLPQAFDLGVQREVARAMGVGTTSLLVPTDASGRLVTPSGPFEGLGLNPARSSAGVSMPAVRAEPSPEMRTRPVTTADSSKVAPVRPKRAFRADDSLAPTAETLHRRDTP